jgi:hypothetical protein
VELEFSVAILRLAKMLPMTGTIKFNRHFRFFAKEIDDAAADRVLATKL